MRLVFAQLRTTADKREIKDFTKLPSATSFIRKTLINIRKETENDCNDIKSVNDKVLSQKNEYETLSLAPTSVLPNHQKTFIQ